MLPGLNRDTPIEYVVLFQTAVGFLVGTTIPSIHPLRAAIFNGVNTAMQYPPLDITVRKIVDGNIDSVHVVAQTTRTWMGTFPALQKINAWVDAKTANWTKEKSSNAISIALTYITATMLTCISMRILRVPFRLTSAIALSTTSFFLTLGFIIFKVSQLALGILSCVKASSSYNGNYLRNRRGYMKIVVFSTDGICCRLIEKALPHHRVTVVCPSPQSVEAHHKNLHVVCGSIEDPQSLDTALKGQDAVVTAINGALLGTSTEAIIQAMRRSGVRRFIAITPPKKKARSLIARLLERFAQSAVGEVSAIEWIMKKSGLKWTIVCPPELTNAPPTGHYTLTTEPKGELSCADLADFMLDELSSTEHLGKVIGLAT